MRAKLREATRVWGALAAVTITLLAVLATVGVASAEQALKPQPATKTKDVVVTAATFRSLQSMTKVRGFYIDNVLGHVQRTLKVANSPTGGRYPVGTVIQLIPQEAMVKHAKGFNRATKDWEFFSLAVSPTGTQILTRGTDDVVNRFGGSCASCHRAADPRFDMVCENDHGCAPLPVTDDLIKVIQDADPRPQ
jgi:hypothetical protein